MLFPQMCQEFGNFSMVMELAGGSLDGFLTKKGVSARRQLPEAQFFSLARGIALGMRHLAASRIVHRDLACRNVLLDKRGVPKISDFGFSRVLGDEADGKGKTQTNVGPIRWMAPENIRHLEYSEKSDVWSYGAVLIEMISGDEPFAGMQAVDVATMVRDGQNTALNFIPQDVDAPIWVMKLIALCFTYDASSRPDFDAVVSFLDSHKPEGASDEVELEESQEEEPLIVPPRQPRAEGETDYTAIRAP